MNSVNEQLNWQLGGDKIKVFTTLLKLDMQFLKGNLKPQVSGESK